MHQNRGVEICELIEAIVDETKDSLVDAIGSMKEDFQDNLPFNEDPCSFMPKPKDIPAMNFVNDLAFDAIFDPIELESIHSFILRKLW